MIRIAEVTFSGFPSDPRPRRESEALRDAGMEIDMFCLSRDSQPKNEKSNRINVIRLNIEKKRAGKIRYIFQYVQFIITIFILLSIYQFKRKYKIIHIHNMPDALVFSALIPKLFGAKIILDLHDPMPEMFITKFSLNEENKAIKILKFFEKLSIKFADVVFTPNISFKEKFISRGCPENKIHIIMNSPQEQIFYSKTVLEKNSNTQNKNRFRMMYHGMVVERHGLDDALKAIQLVKDKIPNLEFNVFGPGEYTEKFLQLVNEYKLDQIVNHMGKVKLEQIAEEITQIDLGIIPNKLNPFTNINFPTRIFEYLCLQKPVIVPSTKGIKDYFDDSSIFFFKPGNPESLAESILKVYSDTENTKNVVANGFRIYERHKWKNESEKLVNIVKDLLGIEKLSENQYNEEILTK